MKIMTILGTRPEIIRLSLIIKKLDLYSDHVLVHTGQNYDKQLSDVFFEELQIRKPDYYLGVQGSTFGEQISKIIAASEKVLSDVKPDRLLILGDTNSALAAIVAKRLAIPVYHMEAGNRCFDDRVPEEVNRRIIDHSSDVLLPYTEGSRSNLLREGIAAERVYVVGNPIYEVLNHYAERIEASKILAELTLSHKGYILVTMHREENVDLPDRLASLVEGVKRLQETFKLPVICSTHPRTRLRLEKMNFVEIGKSISFLEPFSFCDFVHLEKNAFCVLTDSGTVQEECCIFKVANVTIRDVTERPETVEVGSNVLSGAGADSIVDCVKLATGNKQQWAVPTEYLVENVSTAVLKILLAYNNHNILKVY